MKKKILFIDRDGTLLEEPHNTAQIDCIKKFALEPNVIQALLSLKQAGFIFVMITNQDGLGTINFPKKNFYNLHNLMMKIFSSQNINFDAVLICPHLPSDKCNCRKPKITLIQNWLQNNTLDKITSYVIGDRQTDLMLAKNLGINGILYQRDNFNWKNISDKLISANRYAKVSRITKETIVNIEVWIDQINNSNINTGIKFFNHMLEQIAVQGRIRMNIMVKGDLDIDDHHIVEDTALVLGETLKQALGNKLGIGRFGFILPMDECLAHAALDISNRPYLNYKVNYNVQKIGDLSTDMIEHFFRSLSNSMGCTLHLKAHGKNDHHKAESLFKAFGRTLLQAIRIDNNIIPSSKGIL